MSRSSLFNVVAVLIFGTGIILFFQYHTADTEPIAAAPETQVSAVETAVSTTTSATTISTTTTVSVPPEATTTPIKKPVKPSSGAISQVSDSVPNNEAVRIENPYATPAESFTQVNTDARAALVNILCEPRGSSSLRPISGSGVVIDPRGVILTNAHVAQYVLLSESPQVDLACTVRTGSPAQPAWTAAVLFIPPVWVNAHAGDILSSRPTGTGEHDYALLYITGSATSNPLPASFAYLPVDTRPAIGFPGDQVLVASYPAEFVGGIAAQYDLYSDTSITTVKQLLTFASGTPDLLSLGGIIEAQSGSSGGAVVNAWGRLVAIIATTSDGATTADRDLRGIALDYINTDFAAQSGATLAVTLAGDPAIETQNFTSSIAPTLIEKYVALLSKQTQ